MLMMILDGLDMNVQSPFRQKRFWYILIKPNRLTEEAYQLNITPHCLTNRTKLVVPKHFVFIGFMMSEMWNLTYFRAAFGAKIFVSVHACATFRTIVCVWRRNCLCVRLTCSFLRRHHRRIISLFEDLLDFKNAFAKLSKRVNHNGENPRKNKTDAQNYNSIKNCPEIKIIEKTIIKNNIVTPNTATARYFILLPEFLNKKSINIKTVLSEKINFCFVHWFLHF